MVRRGEDVAENGDLATVREDVREHEGVDKRSEEAGLAGHEDTTAGRGESQENTGGEYEKEEDDSEHLFLPSVAKIRTDLFSPPPSRRNNRDSLLHRLPRRPWPSPLLLHIPAQVDRVSVRGFLGLPPQESLPLQQESLAQQAEEGL